jgi:hypothetical protein
MLNLAGRRSKAKKDAAVAPLERPIARTGAERAARLIATARSKLEPMVASADEGFDAVRANKKHAELGDVDGVGLLLKLASFPTSADGTLSDEDYRHFEREGALLIDTMCSSMLNCEPPRIELWSLQCSPCPHTPSTPAHIADPTFILGGADSVVSSLLLTIFVSLQVMNVGSQPYETAASARHHIGTTSNTAAAGDAAAFLWPHDPEAFRWVFYVLECFFLSLGTPLCTLALLVNLSRLVMLSNLPSVAAKLEYLMGRLKVLMLCTALMFFSLMILVTMALPAMLARASAVAFLSACAAALILVVLFVRYSWASDEIKVQVAEARIVLAASRGGDAAST